MRCVNLKMVLSFPVSLVSLHKVIEKAEERCDRSYFTERKYVSAAKLKRTFHTGGIKKKPQPREYIVKKPLHYLQKNSEASEVTKTTKAPNASPSTSKVEDASAEPATCGHYELNPLMSKMLEAELDDIMMKVWDALPDDPKDDAVKLVVKRFKNKAGDELRDVIGLNVTKRLLNVHNPLYVKVVFSNQPWRAELANFIKKYHITSFKRVNPLGAVFAAKVNNFQDFDELCTNKNLTMGDNIHVTVTPCYQFMTRPENLRTCYDLKVSKPHKKIAKVSIQSKKTDKDTIPTSTLESKANKDTKTELTNVANTKNIKSAVLKFLFEFESQVPNTSQKVNTNLQQKSATIHKQNVAATPSETNKSTTTKEVAPKATPSNKIGLNDNVAPKMTPAKTKIVTTENKQVPTKETPVKLNPAPKVTPTKPSQAVVQKQNAPLKVTPGNSNQTEAQKKNIAVTQKQNPAPKAAPSKPNATPSKSAIENNQTQTPKVTPAKATTANVQNTTPKVTPAKTAPANVQNTTPKVNPTKTAPANVQNTTPKVNPTKATPGNVQNTTPKVNPTKATPGNVQNTTPKVNPTKATPANIQNTTPKVTSVKLASDPQKAASKPPFKQNAAAVANPTTKSVAQTQKPAAKTAIQATKVMPAKPAAREVKKKVPIKAIKPKFSPKKHRESDFDELDDHDILAMLSGGIVLDEYVGSDED